MLFSETNTFRQLFSREEAVRLQQIYICGTIGSIKLMTALKGSKILNGAGSYLFCEENL